MIKNIIHVIKILIILIAIFTAFIIGYGFGVDNI